MTEYTYDYTDREFYNQVYDLLIREAGARDYIHDQTSFVDAYCKIQYPATEYRFGGKLGWGGKFYRSGDRFTVSCYPEDRSVEIDAIIKKVNLGLAALVTTYNPQMVRRKDP